MDLDLTGKLALVTGSLTDESLLARTSEPSIVSILPDANVLKIGGQSIMDRGRAALPFTLGLDVL
jgi:molybdenum storage protein